MKGQGLMISNEPVLPRLEERSRVECSFESLFVIATVRALVC